LEEVQALTSLVARCHRHAQGLREIATGNRQPTILLPGPVLA
jgi:hypothetical protein